MIHTKNTFSYKNALLYALVLMAITVLLTALNMNYPGKVMLPLLKALYLAAVMTIYGYFILGLFGNADESPDVPAAFAVGLIFTTFFFFAAGFFKLVILPVIIVYYLLPLPLLWVMLKKRKDALKKSLYVFSHRSPLAYPVFFLPLIFASLPPSFYDTLVYHLGIPNLYLQHGGFIQTPQFLFANTSIYYEISLIPAVFAGDLTPRLFHLVLGIILMLAAADFAKEFFGLKKRHIFIVLAMSMPMSVFLLSTVKNDLASALFILLGIKFLLKDNYSKAGLFWGFAIGIKYFNGLPLLVFLIILLITRKTFPVKPLIRFTVVFTVVLMPLLIKNYMYAGNPFFPFLSSVFPSEYWDSSRFHLMQSDVGRMVHSFKDLLVLPYTVSFKHSGFGGMVGGQFLAFLPFLLLFKERLKHKIYLLVFALVTLYIGAVFTGSVRFLYIAFLVLTVYLALIYERLSELPHWKWIRVLFMAVVVFNLVTALSVQEHMNRSFRLLSGTTEVETYTSTMFPAYPAIAYINEHPPAPGAGGEPSQVLLVGEARNYYLKHPYIVASGVDYSILKKYLEQSETINDFLSVLRSDHIGAIIFNAAEFNRLQQGYQRMTEKELRHMTLFFQQMQDRIVFKQRNLVVFSLASTGTGNRAP